MDYREQQSHREQVKEYERNDAQNRPGRAEKLIEFLDKNKNLRDTSQYKR